MGIYQKRNQRYQKKRQFACTLFLVHLPYSINKSIRINVLYHPWYQHCIIWVMSMRKNISSSVCQNLFWEYIIKVGCTSAVIFLWEITEKKRKKTKLSYLVMAFIYAILYTAESVYLSNCVSVTRHVAPNWSFYYSLQ